MDSREIPVMLFALVLKVLVGAEEMQRMMIEAIGRRSGRGRSTLLLPANGHASPYLCVGSEPCLF
jgi:hypothetical protein